MVLINRWHICVLLIVVVGFAFQPIYNLLLSHSRRHWELNSDKDHLQLAEQALGTAYIITTDHVLTDGVKDAAKACGFVPKLVPAIQPFHEMYKNKDEMVKSCISVAGYNTSTHTPKHMSLGEIALICSHRVVLNMIAVDPDTAASDWSLILEDDARLHPEARDVKQLITEAIRVSQHDSINYGFIYLGICGPTCSRNTSEGKIGIDCYGSCSHGIMVTKQRAKQLFIDMYGPYQHYPLPVDDALIVLLGPGKHRKELEPLRSSAKIPTAYSVGMHLTSPDAHDHKGLLYQCCRKDDVKVSGSALLAKDTFRNITCYQAQMTGRLGNLLFEYAALIGLCASHGVAPGWCAGMAYPLEEATRRPAMLPVEEFARTFRLSRFTCPLAASGALPTSARTYAEHAAHPYAIQYDPEVLRQASGTTLTGYFQSYKYFHPHAEAVVRATFSFSPKVTRAAMERLSRVTDSLDRANNIVCLACRRGDKVGDKFYNQWSLSSDYYVQAISHFVAKYRSVTVLVFMGGAADGARGDQARADFAWLGEDLLPRLRKIPGVGVHDTHMWSSLGHIDAFSTLVQCPNIVAGASSFSWWAAYLSNHSNVVAPGKIQDGATFVAGDYYPPEWTVLNPPSA